jgi:hypothetical protein
MTEAYVSGLTARGKGRPASDNPFAREVVSFKKWNEGWVAMNSGIEQLIANGKSMASEIDRAKMAGTSMRK